MSSDAECSPNRAREEDAAQGENKDDQEAFEAAQREFLEAVRANQRARTAMDRARDAWLDETTAGRELVANHDEWHAAFLLMSAKVRVAEIAFQSATQESKRRDYANLVITMMSRSSGTWSPYMEDKSGKSIEDFKVKMDRATEVATEAQQKLDGHLRVLKRLGPLQNASEMYKKGPECTPFDDGSEQYKTFVAAREAADKAHANYKNTVEKLWEFGLDISNF